MQDLPNMKLTQEQKSVIEQLLPADENARRNIDVPNLLQKACRLHPDLFFGAMQEAAQSAKDLMGRLDELRNNLSKEDGEGFRTFFAPIKHFFFALTSGFDPEISQVYFARAQGFKRRLKLVLGQAAIETDKRSKFVKEYLELINKVLGAYAMELISNYDKTGGVQKESNGVLR